MCGVVQESDAHNDVCARVLIQRLDAASAHWFHKDKEDGSRSSFFTTMVCTVVRTWQHVLAIHYNGRPEATKLRHELKKAHHQVVKDMLHQLGMAHVFPFDNAEDSFWPAFMTMFDNPLTAFRSGTFYHHDCFIAQSVPAHRHHRHDSL